MCISFEFIIVCIDTEYDDYDQVCAVRALAAIFTVLVKEKEQAPLHYWLEDYEVCFHIKCVLQIIALTYTLDG